MSLALQLPPRDPATDAAARPRRAAWRPVRLAALAIAFAAPAIGFGADDSVRLASMSDTELQTGMQSGVQAVLQHVPMRMEDQSVLVGAEYSPETRTATYHYVRVARVDPELLRAHLTAKNCGTPNTRAMMARGIRFVHLYTVGDDVYGVTISGDACGGPERAPAS